MAEDPGGCVVGRPTRLETKKRTTSRLANESESMKRREESLGSAGCILVALLVASAAFGGEQRHWVNTRRVPQGGIQPQAVTDADGTLHVIYYKGKASQGDVYYVRSSDSGETFSAPMRVNSQPGSAVAIGTIRGPQLSLGKNSRVHVAWNGSAKARPKGLANPDLPEDSPYRHSAPMLYARMNDEATGFQTQRNLMTHTYSLDGGGSVAADDRGNVYVVWHANSQQQDSTGEGGRAVWVAVSRDGGMTFAPEIRANREQTGACGCCSLKAQVDSRGNVYVLYRSAREKINRDMYLLVSTDRGARFTATKLDDWKIGACVMSSAALDRTSRGMLAAWETEQRVKFAPVDGLTSGSRRITLAPGGNQEPRKHPTLATGSDGKVILVWTEGTGWQKGGAVAWQVFDKSGNPISAGSGRIDGLPVWSFAAVYARADGGFTVIY